MPWLPPLAAAVVALGVAVLLPGVLRALPEPHDDPDAATKTPYRDLATPAFVAGTAVAVLPASALAFSVAPPDLWLAWAALSVVGVTQAAIDLRTTWLPLPLARAGWVCAAVGVGVAAALRQDVAPLVWAAVGCLGLWVLFEVMWRVTAGFGYGDVRLMATVGAVAGAHDPRLIMPAAIAGTVIGAVWGIIRRARRGPGPFPYGPALVAGPFIALAWWALTP